MTTTTNTAQFRAVPRTQRVLSPWRTAEFGFQSVFEYCVGRLIDIAVGTSGVGGR